MSRVKEVEVEVVDILADNCQTIEEDRFSDLARTLAAEVDELRGKLPIDWQEKGPRCAHLNCCAEAYCANDIITKLLEMLKDNEPGCIHGVSYYTDAQNKQAELYLRACKIAGRTE